MSVYGSILEFKAGDVIRIVELKLADNNHVRKLTAFGLLPGIELKVVQTFPAIVLLVGHSQIALDYEIARLIIVKYEGTNRRQGKK